MFEKSKGSWTENYLIFLAVLLAGIIIVLLILLSFSVNQSTKNEKNFRRELKIQKMQNSLSMSLIEANQNEFEVSRQTANDFFMALETELTSKDDSAFNENQKEKLSEAVKKKEIINQHLAEKKSSSL